VLRRRLLERVADEVRIHRGDRTEPGLPPARRAVGVRGRLAPVPTRSIAARSLATAFALVLLIACGDDDTGGASSDGDAPTDSTELSPELASVVEDAQRMAPALESELRGTDYPTDLAGALDVLTSAGIEPTDGNVVGGYEYDPDTVEFVLCIEGPSGAFASYDTRPMSLFTTGESSGCPT
jgi:hypothetical protein